MTTTLDLRNARRLFYGGTEAQRLYYGSQLLWTKPPSFPTLSVSNYAFWDADALPVGAAPASWPVTQAAGMGVGMSWDRGGSPTVALDPNGRKWINFDAGAYYRDGQAFPADMAISIWIMMRPASSTVPILYNGPTNLSLEVNTLSLARGDMYVRASDGLQFYSSVTNSGTTPLVYQWSRPTGGTSGTVTAWQEGVSKSSAFSKNRSFSLNAPRFSWGSTPNGDGSFSGTTDMRSSCMLVTFGETLNASDRTALQAWAVQRRAA